VVSTLFTAYATVALVTTVLVLFASKRLGDERRPVLQRFALSLAAGVVWPVMVIGVVEISSFAAYAKVHEHDDETARVDVLA
jgi:hypothetical protein